MKKLRQFLFWFQPRFHVFTVVCAISFLCWKVYSFEIQKIEISTIIQVLAPELLDSFSGDNPIKPTDFVNNLNK